MSVNSTIFTYYSDLTLFKISVKSQPFSTNPSRGFNVDNNIIYLINNNHIKIFELY